MARFLRFEHVSFQYPGMTKPLLSDVDAHFARGWHGFPVHVLVNARRRCYQILRHAAV